MNVVNVYGCIFEPVIQVYPQWMTFYQHKQKNGFEIHNDRHLIDLQMCTEMSGFFMCDESICEIS